MNGFPVKKCSAFQFFKKRVRFSFNFFFFFLLLLLHFLLSQSREKVIEEGKCLRWSPTLPSPWHGCSTEHQGQQQCRWRGAGWGDQAGCPKGITSALFAVECVSLSQLTPGLDAIQAAIQAGIMHSKAECRDVAACLWLSPPHPSKVMTPSTPSIYFPEVWHYPHPFILSQSKGKKRTKKHLWAQENTSHLVICLQS